MLYNNIMKKVIGILLIALLLPICWYSWKHFAPYEIRNTPVKEGPIVAFGDSLVEGVGSTDGTGFVALLSKAIGKPVVNLGKSGDTTESAILRVDSALQFKPEVVIVLLGGNDYLKRIPKVDTFKNLALIVDKFQENGAAVLVLGVRGGALRDTYNKDFKNFARAHNTGFVSNVLDDIIGESALMSDGIHPNDAGYAIIAERVVKELIQLLND